MAKSNSQTNRPSVPRVFISSTVADLEPYRAAAREAAIAVGMLPVMCGDFAASDHRPPLDECLARVKETDVLIVLTAHRYGWIPDDQSSEKPRKSITWLECQQAVDKTCEVLGFLIGHDGEWAAEQKEDYRLFVAFKEKQLTAELQSEVEESVDGLATFHQWLNSRGIRKRVQTPSELSTQIVLALKEWHERHPDFDQPAIEAGQTVTPDKYLATLLEQSSYIDIRGLAVGSGKAHRFPIEDLYISLNSRQPVRDQDQVSAKKRRDAETKSINSATMADRPLGERSEVPLHAALAERRLVIIGDPGAGKTTFLRRIAAALCLTELRTVPQAAQSRLGIGDRTFPIVLRCAILADHIAKHLKNAGTPSDPASPVWLAHCLAAENVTGLDQAFFQRQLEDGRCTVMLDGLDEAPDPARRANLSKLAENLSQTFTCCRFVVTSRPPAYTGTIVLPQFSHVEIAPLTDDAIERFLEHWCGQLYGDKSPDSLEHRRVLLDSLHSRPEIRRVARNPVMLTALAVVHWNQQRLPEQRAELYDSVITWLSRSRESRPDRETPEKCITLLQNLALAMHDHAEGRKTQVSKHWAAEHVLAKFFGPGNPTATSIAATEKFLTEEELDSGIVVAAGNDIKFWHLQFQEYLAARAIAGESETEQQAILFGTNSKLYRPEWREVILLLAGALHKQGEAKVAWFVNQVLNGLPTSEPTTEDDEPLLAAEARCAGLLGAVFHDLQPVGYQPTDKRYHELLDRVLAIFDRKRSQLVDVQVRIAAAEALGQVGDPRLGPGSLDRWIKIPAGSFLMGSQKSDAKLPNFDDEADDDEMPVCGITLDEFWIARYPVTVGEFLLFIEQNGYLEKNHWKHGGFGEYQEPGDWEDQIACKNRPVVGVSWYEAMAYCEFAKVRIPTEAEWERAARGATGRKYPWGNEVADETRLNFEGNIGEPTPVGIYPLGATPEGIEDMAGNVWEWCADWHDSYTDEPQVNPVGPQKGDYRVVRGGAWSSVSGNVRTAVRPRSMPGNRDSILGFRVLSLRQDS